MPISNNIVDQISSAIVYSLFPARKWCSAETHIALNEALIKVVNGEIGKLSHMQALGNLDTALATIAQEAKLAYFTEEDK